MAYVHIRWTVGELEAIARVLRAEPIFLGRRDTLAAVEAALIKAGRPSTKQRGKKKERGKNTSPRIMLDRARADSVAEKLAAANDPTAKLAAVRLEQQILRAARRGRGSTRNPAA